LQPLLDDHVRSFATQLSVDKLFLENIVQFMKEVG